MAANVLADTGFIVGLLSDGDRHHLWAVDQSSEHAPPWKTCEAVLSEAFHLLGSPGRSALLELLRRGWVTLNFNLADNWDSVLGLMQKYADRPMSLADGCLVRMTEVLADPLVITAVEH